MPSRTIERAESRQAFAETLFSAYPDLRPTRTLYVDLEGSGSGLEEIVSLFWPQLAGVQRFQWILRGPDSEAISPNDLGEALQALECDPASVEWVGVFSGGVPHPDEQLRFEKLFGEGQLPFAWWVNLHEVATVATLTKRSIRQNRYVWHTGEKRTRYSLEALEHEFGIYRPWGLRGYGNSYRDGHPGQIHVLDLARRVRLGAAEPEQERILREYCRFDVESMFRIARRCEKLLQSR